MPEITLTIPENNRFHSSLNEIDLVMGEVLLNQMRIADPRNVLKDQNILADDNKNDWLWDKSRVFQVDELEIPAIFDTYLLRKNINDKKGVDVSYPILAYQQDDIDTVFWGTGNRYRQWEIEIPAVVEDLKIGDEVILTSPLKYRGMSATINTFVSDTKCTVAVNGSTLVELKEKGKKTPVIISIDTLKAVGTSSTTTFKAKAITCKYNSIILCNSKNELQYLRDKFILRCSDANIWFKYNSPAINDAENQIFTVFGIPNLKKYPTSVEKINGHGYIYGASFVTDVWACLTDTPLPQGIIETIRMNLSVENDGRINRIVIN